MALHDITIDTNVLMHACNPAENRCAESIQFLHQLLESNSKLAIDEGFTITPHENKSLIGAEYLEKLIPGSLSYSVIAALASTGRLSIVSASVNAGANKKIIQMIANRRDRTFIKVSLNSQEQSFVSHDYQDFAKDKRKTIKKELGVAIIEASAASELI